MKNFLYKTLAAKATILATAVLTFADQIPTEQFSLNYEKITWTYVRGIFDILALIS